MFESDSVVLVARIVVLLTFSLVDLAMSSQVGDNRKVSTAAFHVACEWLFAGVAVHVCLERARSCEALVADLALVLLLRAGGDLGAELSHHRLRCRRQAAVD